MSNERRDQLKIFEIFYSLQGESSLTGLPTVFIRLTGCPLRCSWCDTEYAFHGGAWLSFAEIIRQVKTHNTPYVCVTGGEPLSQKRVHQLMDQLIDAGFQVSLETSGAISVEAVNPKVIKVIDMKAPGSGEQAKNHYKNFKYLSSKDQIKFVIADEQDYQWSKSLISEYDLCDKNQVLMSPVADVLNPTLLANWILADELQVRFQIQLHKHLWGDKPGT